MTRKPYHSELEDLVRWFTHHMSQETRGKLMGELPVHYRLLYPNVSDEIITSRVTERLQDISSQNDPLPRTFNL